MFDWLHETGDPVGATRPVHSRRLGPMAPG